MIDEYDEDDFDDVFFEYARRALEMAGVETDPRLKIERPIRYPLLHVLSENRIRYGQARDAVPRTDAHWEQAEFLRIAVRVAIWDLQFGAIRNFAQFDYLYRRILGERSRRYLPQVFAAACWLPSLTNDFAASLLATMPDRLYCDL